MMSYEKVMKYCIKYEYCTGLSSIQYSTMLIYADEHKTHYEDVATMIWLGSHTGMTLQLFKVVFKNTMK